MENTTNKKKAWLPLLLVVGGLIVILVVGLIFLSSTAKSPYQRVLAEFKACMQDELGVEVIYTKDLPPDFTGYALGTAMALFKTGLAPLTDNVEQSYWEYREVDCKRVASEFNYLKKQNSKPLYIVDIYNEEKETFDSGPIMKQVENFNQNKAKERKK